MGHILQEPVNFKLILQWFFEGTSSMHGCFSYSCSLHQVLVVTSIQNIAVSQFFVLSSLMLAKWLLIQKSPCWKIENICNMTLTSKKMFIWKKIWQNWLQQYVMEKDVASTRIAQRPGAEPKFQDLEILYLEVFACVLTNSKAMKTTQEQQILRENLLLQQTQSL